MATTSNLMKDLFTKHKIQSGKVVVRHIDYMTLNNVYVNIEVTADNNSRNFYNIVPYNMNQNWNDFNEFLDRFIESIRIDIDIWLKSIVSFGLLKKTLEGLSIYEKTHNI